MKTGKLKVTKHIDISEKGNFGKSRLLLEVVQFLLSIIMAKIDILIQANHFVFHDWQILTNNFSNINILSVILQAFNTRSFLPPHVYFSRIFTSDFFFWSRALFHTLTITHSQDPYIESFSNNFDISKNVSNAARYIKWTT